MAWVVAYAPYWHTSQAFREARQLAKHWHYYSLIHVSIDLTGELLAAGLAVCNGSARRMRGHAGLVCPRALITCLLFIDRQGASREISERVEPGDKVRGLANIGIIKLSLT